MKQPRVPEYAENEGMGAYMRKLVMFLKDFCAGVWREHSNMAKEIEALKAEIEKLKA